MRIMMISVLVGIAVAPNLCFGRKVEVDTLAAPEQKAEELFTKLPIQFKSVLQQLGINTPEYVDSLDKAGLKHKPTNVEKWEQLLGAFVPGHRSRIIVARNYLSKDRAKYAGVPMVTVLAHEIGHAYDWARGRLSKDPSFRAAYKKDTSARSDKSKAISNYLEAKDAESEAFAEAFGIHLCDLLNNRDASQSAHDEEFRKYFRRVMLYVGGVIARELNHSPSEQMDQLPSSIIETYAPTPVEVAEATLGEDSFLQPVLGNASLHLDVPFSADVKIFYQHHSPDNVVQNLEHWVQGRGKYRHLTLTGLVANRRTEVKVTAYLPTGRSSPLEVGHVKSMMMKAGDRKYLAFSQADFRKTYKPKDILVLIPLDTSNGEPLAAPAVSPPATDEGSDTVNETSAPAPGNRTSGEPPSEAATDASDADPFGDDAN